MTEPSGVSDNICDRNRRRQVQTYAIVARCPLFDTKDLFWWRNWRYLRRRQKHALDPALSVRRVV